MLDLLILLLYLKTSLLEGRLVMAARTKVRNPSLTVMRHHRDSKANESQTPSPKQSSGSRRTKKRGFVHLV